MNEYLEVMDRVLELIKESEIEEKDKTLIFTEHLFTLFIANEKLCNEVVEIIKKNQGSKLF